MLIWGLLGAPGMNGTTKSVPWYQSPDKCQLGMGGRVEGKCAPDAIDPELGYCPSCGAGIEARIAPAGWNDGRCGGLDLKVEDMPLVRL